MREISDEDLFLPCLFSIDITHDSSIAPFLENLKSMVSIVGDKSRFGLSLANNGDVELHCGR